MRRCRGSSTPRGDSPRRRWNGCDSRPSQPSTCNANTNFQARSTRRSGCGWPLEQRAARSQASQRPGSSASLTHRALDRVAAARCTTNGARSARQPQPRSNANALHRPVAFATRTCQKAHSRMFGRVPGITPPDVRREHVPLERLQAARAGRCSQSCAWRLRLRSEVRAPPDWVLCIARHRASFRSRDHQRGNRQLDEEI